MTKVSYNVISNVGNTILYTGIKSYPQAASTAASVGGTVVTVYSPTEIKDEVPPAKFRLVAKLA